MKQEFKLENIMLKNYRSLQNITIFLLGAMNFVSEISNNLGKYFCNFIIKEARSLNEKKLKHKEHGIITGTREILSINSIGIREFLQKKLDKLYSILRTQLFDKIANTYKNLGEL
ncbi:hypothetical protein KAZ01_02270 [Candidatus Gracilibacteria bacterium]|nr:hypothetical protein [Candidatus Gracilibacteria bacterium]